MRFLSSALVFGWILLPARAWAILEHLVFSQIQVDVTVSQQAQTGIFLYEYAVTNSTANNLDLIGFSIDVSRPAGPPLSFEGLTHGKLLFATATEIIQKESHRMIPVGLDFTDGSWWGGLGADDEGVITDWTPAKGVPDPKPGETVRGFLLRSFGLPGIRQAFGVPAKGDILDEQLTGNETEEEIRALYERLVARTLTVGPDLDPRERPLTAVELLQRLISLKDRAHRELGWITNDGVANSLNVKLQNALRMLRENKPGSHNAAQGMLTSFLKELEAQKDKKVSNNAYQLLKPNAIYILKNFLTTEEKK